MPHLFTNRLRHSDLISKSPDLRDHFKWEQRNAALYELGGAIFIAGSIFFFPRLEAYENLGAWLFFIGSLAYLVVTTHDMAELRSYWKVRRPGILGGRLEYIAGSAYLAGTLLFTAGSLFFLSWWDWYTLGAWCFVIGSLLFVIGSSINVLQILKAPSLFTMQLMNLTAVTFVVGSTLFVVASVPYLWTIKSVTDRDTLFAFLAVQYLVGSILFFVGGLFNAYRAHAMMRSQVARSRQ